LHRLTAFSITLPSAIGSLTVYFVQMEVKYDHSAVAFTGIRVSVSVGALAKRMPQPDLQMFFPLCCLMPDNLSPATFA
jgi:uncharacterized membrane protein YfcA